MLYNFLIIMLMIKGNMLLEGFFVGLRDSILLYTRRKTGFFYHRGGYI